MNFLSLIISLFSFLISFSSISQTEQDFLIENLDSITASDLNWKVIEKRKLSKTNKKDLIRLLKDSSYYFNDCSEGNIEAYFPYFHFVDLDQDNDLDLVFNGKACNGHEMKSIYVFMNNNGTYTLTVQEAGTILKVDPSSKELLFYEYPCCSSVSNVYRIYKIARDTVSLDYGIIVYATSFSHLDTASPYQMKKSAESIDLPAGTKLYLYPPKKSNYDSYFNQDNFAGECNDLITASVYSIYTDESGYTWKCCIIENKQVKLSNKHTDKRYTHLMLWTKE